MNNIFKYYAEPSDLGGNKTKRLLILAVLAIALVGMAGAANYMYEKASVKGVGYKNVEMIVSTQKGFNGDKLVEKESGSGNVITEKTELEAERQIGSNCLGGDYMVLETYEPGEEPSGQLGRIPSGDWGIPHWYYYELDSGQIVAINYPSWPNNFGPVDYINFTKEAEFEYMPVSYQTGTYDQKWVEKLCVQNYRIGAVLTEMYTHAEHLQKTTEVKTRSYDPVYSQIVWMEIGSSPDDMLHFDFTYPPAPCCTGVLEANLNSNVIGVAHIGWLSRDPQADNQLKGRHAEYGRSVEDLTGVFSIEKFIQLWGNSTCGAISVDWLPCM
jgi:hypothetical protein